MSSERIPSWRRLRTAKQREVVIQKTNEGRYDLTSTEKWWRDRYQILLDHGYKMRPRFSPDWVPSWKDNDLNPTYCEDARVNIISVIMDATRISDDSVVVIKKGLKSLKEGLFTQYFSSPERASAKENHCVPVYEVIEDADPEYEFIVIPLLRPFDDPPLESVCQALDFVEQTLQGLKYIHEEGMAHLDCSWGNIMMDATSLFPEGFHPAYPDLSKDCLATAKVRRRGDAGPVKYYFIDFGLSCFLDEGDKTTAIGLNRQDQEVPELSSIELYLALPVDVFTLGNVYKKKLLDLYTNLEFLRPLVDAMMQKNPSDRPTSAEAFAQFKQLHSPRSGTSLRWRLRKRNESRSQQLIGDVMSIANEGAFIVRSIITAPVKVGGRLISSDRTSAS